MYSMRILGIDPGLQNLGLGVVKIEKGEILFAAHALIHHPHQTPEERFNEHMNAGLYQIAVDFPQFLDLSRPNLIVAELVPPGKLGSNSERAVAAITVCKVIAYQWGIEWIDIAASTVKKQLTGDHRANKTAVRNAVIALFPIMKERHALLKAEQKENQEKVTGLPQDVFDGVGIAWVGAKLYGKRDGKVHS